MMVGPKIFSQPQRVPTARGEKASFIVPMNPEEEGKILRNFSSKAIKRKPSNQNSLNRNDILIYF